VDWDAEKEVNIRVKNKVKYIDTKQSNEKNNQNFKSKRQDYHMK